MDSEFLDLLRRRRSVRKFHDKKIEPEKIDALVEAVLRAPTSRGRNPWEFLVIDSPDILDKLGSAKQHGASLISGAPLAVVVTADTTVSDVWIEDCAIAAIILQLAALDFGLGSCWVQLRLRQYNDYLSSEEYLRSLLNLPPDRAVVCVVAIGYPAEEPPGHSRESLPFAKVHYGRYDI